MRTLSISPVFVIRRYERDIVEMFGNWKIAVIQLAKTNLRQEFGSLALDESLTARERISGHVNEALDRLTKEWGLKVRKDKIKLVDTSSCSNH